MEFKYFTPSDILKPYVKHYYVFESGSDAGFEDIVFPSGDMEVIFNLGGGFWEASVGNKFLKNPPVELWGQITKPLPIRSSGKHSMFGVKFFSHSASYLLNEEIGLFNDQVSDLSDILGSAITDLHDQLLNTRDNNSRVQALEAFLIKRLMANDRKTPKIDKIGDILMSIKKDPSENNLSNVASKYGITPRYLHKLIHQHTGLSPVFFNKIVRFQRSLKLIAKNDLSFTTVAYSSGYFDQSHFIRDFKSFTGVTPSAYLENITPVNQLLLQ
jgi:AraC-like DNA-binding protein